MSRPFSVLLRTLLSSLKLRLIVGVTLLLLVSLWGYAIFISRHQTDMQMQMLVEQQRATIDYVGEDIDQRFGRRLEQLQQASTVLPLDKLADSAALEAFLQQRPALHKMFDVGVIVVKPDASGAFADYPPVPGRRLHKFDHFTAVADAIASGKPAVGKPFIGPIIQRPVIGFAVPVHDAGGRLVAVLAGVSSAHAPDLLGLIREHRYGKTGDFVVIAPQYDMVVTGSDPDYLLRPLPAPGISVMLDRFRRGQEGSGVTTDSRGIEQLVTGRRLSAVPGWWVVVRLPTAEAFAAVTTARQIAFGGAALLSLLVALLATLVVRRALAPLGRVTSELDAIAQDRATLHALPVECDDEVGRLVASINRLQQRLQQKEGELIASRERLQDITDSIPVAVYRYRIEDDGHPNLIYVSSRVEALWGIQADVAMQDVTQLFRRIHPEDLPAFVEADHAASAARTPFAHDVRVLLDDGRMRWLHLQSVPKTLADGSAVFSGFVQDITERKLAEVEMRQLQQRFTVAFSASPIAASISRARDGCYIEINAQYERDFGWSRAELIGRTAIDAGIWEDMATRDEWIRLMLRERHLVDFKTRWRRKDGEIRDVSISAEIIELDGETCLIGFVADITTRLAEERALEASRRELEHLAHFDTLTGIPNRVLLADRMHQAIARTRRNGGLMALCYLDLDGFKPVNDAYGHDAGDRLLVEISRRLLDCMRGADTVARLGGDEFVLLLLDLEQRDEAEAALRRILEAVAAPLQVEGHEVTLSASIGVTLFPDDDADPDTLLRHADQAMYAAKQGGKNRWQMFDPGDPLKS